MIFKLIIYLLESISGLAINFLKIGLYPSKCGTLPDPAGTLMLNCSATQLRVTY